MLRYEATGSIARLTFDRPEKLNAQTASFWGELRDGLARAAADPEVRSVVFSGEGRCFSVGGDIEGFGDLGNTGERREYVQDALSALIAVEECPKPTIAAVHGLALGGGCELTITCDIVVCDETARFGMPEAAVGLIPGLGMLRGRSQLNNHWLKYMIFTGAILDAAEAKLAGLVQSVVPAGEHVQEAERIAGLIAQRAPIAISAAKAYLAHDVWKFYSHSVDVVSMLQGTEDHAEGIAAFVDKRPPAFKGA